MKPNIELKQARDFGEIISDCILFIRQNWKGLIKTYFVFCGFFILGNIIFSIMLRMRMASLTAGTTSGEFSSPASIFGIDYFMILIFAFLNIISLTLSLLSYITLYNVQGRQAPTISQVWGYYKYYFWRVTGHALLLGIIFFVGLIILVVPITLVAGGGNPFVVGVLILIVFLIPIVYFLTVFSLFFPIVIVENANFGYAFGRSFKLIRGKWWNTFGVIIVTAIMVYAGYLLIIIPFSIASGGMITFFSYNLSVPMIILYTALISLAQVLSILPLSANAVTYFSYVEDKDGAGLFERIDSIGKAADDSDSTHEEY